MPNVYWLNFPFIEVNRNIQNGRTFTYFSWTIFRLKLKVGCRREASCCLCPTNHDNLFAKLKFRRCTLISSAGVLRWHGAIGLLVITCWKMPFLSRVNRGPKPSFHESPNFGYQINWWESNFHQKKRARPSKELSESIPMRTSVEVWFITKETSI